MTNWQRQLDLHEEWEKVQPGDTPGMNAFCAFTANALKNLTKFDRKDVDDVRDELVERFEGAANDDTLSTEEFDQLMDDLYNWGDMQIGGAFFNAVKVCWVNVAFAQRVVKSHE